VLGRWKNGVTKEGGRRCRPKAPDLGILNWLVLLAAEPPGKQKGRGMALEYRAIQEDTKEASKETGMGGQGPRACAGVQFGWLAYRPHRRGRSHERKEKGRCCAGVCGIAANEAKVRLDFHSSPVTSAVVVNRSPKIGPTTLEITPIWKREVRSCSRREEIDDRSTEKNIANAPDLLKLQGAGGGGAIQKERKKRVF